MPTSFMRVSLNSILLIFPNEKNANYTMNSATIFGVLVVCLIVVLAFVYYARKQESYTPVQPPQSPQSPPPPQMCMSAERIAAAVRFPGLHGQTAQANAAASACADAVTGFINPYASSKSVLKATQDQVNAWSKCAKAAALIDPSPINEYWATQLKN